MSATAPHCLLLTQTALPSRSDHPSPGHWRFVLATPQGVPTLQAEDDEPSASPERLELLAVIRGLEALDAPSRVVLLNASPRLRRALEQDLARWRADDWHWERFGTMVPIKNADLWRRLDRLLTFHKVQCGPATLEAAHDLRPPPAMVSTHLVLGERRLRIDRPACAEASDNASLYSEATCDSSSARKSSALRHTAGQSGSPGRGSRHSRRALDRGPPWSPHRRGVWAAVQSIWKWFCGQLAAISL